MLIRTLQAAAIAACVLIAGCGDKINDENYAKIQPGMSLSEVQKILGSGEQDTTGGVSIGSGGTVGSSNAANSSRTTFFFKDGDRQIIVEFKDLKVTSARKLGF